MIVCKEIAAILNSGKPVESCLMSRSEIWPKPIEDAMKAIAGQLAAGQSIETVLTADPHLSHSSPMQRTLIASVRAGLLSGRLGDSLLSWNNVYLRRKRSLTLLNTMLFYPIVLVIVAGIAIERTVRGVVPHYQSAVEQLSIPAPQWFQWTVAIHHRITAITIAMVSIAILAIVIWRIRKSRFTNLGLPIDIAQQLRIQSHAISVAGMLLKKRDRMRSN